jgi:hypothetical protein
MVIRDISLLIYLYPKVLRINSAKYLKPLNKSINKG